MSETLDYLRTFAVFPFALRRFQARPRLTPERAEGMIRERLARREENFLRLVERGIFGWPRSPYLPLLRQAGCEQGDVRALVRAHGLEGALGKLRQAGVYIAFEEFKGRKPIRRGGLEYAARGRDFDNPLARRAMEIRTGGSTGAAHAVGIDLDNVADRAAQRLAVMAAHGLAGAPTISWQGILPASGVKRLLFAAYTGNMPARWLSTFGPRASRQWPKYTLGTYYLLLVMRLAGLRVPFPEYLPPDEQPRVIARWAAQAARAHGRCLINTGVSRGARLGQAARAGGFDLSGVTIMGAGEPPTPAKVGQIAGAGARYVPTYGLSDAGMVGAGCAQPADLTDVHVFADSLALTAQPRALAGFDATVPALSLTSLLPTASKLLLNVETDDYGVVEARRCGCALERLGYATHLRQVRSYGKLTGEGVTLIGSEAQRLLEEELPARFGGTPLDYQMLEDEDERGQTRLYLLVHPRVALADEAAVVECLLAGLSRSSAMADVARLAWQQAGTIQVRRAEPVWSARGKLLPLHVARRARNGEAQ